MEPMIQAICFDVGGTLRVTRKVAGRNLDHVKRIQDLIGDPNPPSEFLAALRSREKQYRHWCQKTLLELSEEDLWVKYMLPDHPQDLIREHAIELNRMWRESRARCILPDAVNTLRTLAQRGYKLGIISNTTSSLEAPELLVENGIRELFGSVILSTTFGKRKPHPSLFLAASRELHVDPQNCAYVGDNRSRDLIGARQAGYAKVIIINVEGYIDDEFDPDDESLIDTISEMKPDHQIGQLSELLNIFAAAGRKNGFQQEDNSQPRELFDAALSTMWGVDQRIPFADTFREAKNIGFCRFELNHKVTPQLYRQWDPDHSYVSTVHDPCPSEFTYAELKSRDIMVSSLNDSLREKSVDLIKRSIELAVRLGSRSVVIHAGSICCDKILEERLRTLYLSGESGAANYLELKDQLITDRKNRIAPHMDQVLKSLDQVIDFARGSGVFLALENRYRYYDIPLLEELETLLGLADEDWFGFQYDTGHAHALSALGLVDHKEWLLRFKDRLVGVHLHDVAGIADHQVPGTGNVNFREIASFLSPHVLRTLEVSPEASLQELADGLRHLVACGCISKV